MRNTLITTFAYLISNMPANWIMKMYLRLWFLHTNPNVNLGYIDTWAVQFTDYESAFQAEPLVSYLF